MATPSFQRILGILEQNDVEYVVIGGVAAVLQGAPVTTFDLDALVKVEEGNLDRLAAALDMLNARYREHAGLRPTRHDLSAGGHYLLMTDSGPFDVLSVLGGGRRYEDIVGGAVTMSVDGLSIKVLAMETLIEEKKALGRDKDLIAVRMLEAVVRKKGGKNP